MELNQAVIQLKHMQCISTQHGSEADGTAPIWQTTFPEAEQLNAALSARILHWSASIADVGSFMADGDSYFDNKWLSNRSLHQANVPEVQTLARFLEETVNQLLRDPDPGDRLSVNAMWSVVSKRGLTGRRHNHRGLVSAVYYVDEGDSSTESGGILQFYEDRASSKPTLEVVPKSGLLLLFPSRLAHAVTPYASDRPRIIVSANLELEQAA